jgi:hypothetical protein
MKWPVYTVTCYVFWYVTLPQTNKHEIAYFMFDYSTVRLFLGS